MNNLIVEFYIWYFKFNKVDADYNLKLKDFKDIYLFKNKTEYLNFLKENGVLVEYYPKYLINSPIIRKFKNNNIIVFKGVCDKLIFTLSIYNNLQENYDPINKKIVKFKKK